MMLGSENPLPGRIIMLMTGIVMFTLTVPAYYWYRSQSRKPDYTTKQGVEVVLGKKWNRPTKQQVEHWIEIQIAHWSNRVFHSTYHQPPARKLTEQQCRDAFHGTLLVFYDKEKLSTMGRLSFSGRLSPRWHSFFFSLSKRRAEKLGFDLLN